MDVRSCWLVALAALAAAGCPEEGNEEASGGMAAVPESTEGAGTEAEEPAEEPAAETFVVDRRATLHEAMLRWRRLWRNELGKGVVLAEGNDGWMLAVTGEPNAKAAARELETEAEPTDEPAESLTPTMVATTVSLNVRAEPDAGADHIRTMPKGTVVVAAHGTVDDKTSEPGGRGHWSYVLAAHEAHGWASSRFLEPYDDCLPLPARLIKDVPQGHRPEVRRQLTYTATEIRHEGRTVDAFLLVGRNPDEKSSRFGVFRSNAQCDLAKGPTVVVPGFITDAFVAQTAATTGHSLVVVGSHPEPEIGEDGRVTWRAYRVGATEPIWERTLATGVNLPRSKRDHIEGDVQAEIGGEATHVPVKIELADGTEEHLVFEDDELVPASGA